MDEGIVDPIHEPIEQIMETAVAEQSQPIETADQEQKPDKTMIPLSVAQKLREQKRELELELQWERQRNAQAQQASQKPVEEDNSRYESATKEDLNTSQNEAIRIIEERLWIKQNPEKYEKINEYLPQFLKQRPNLASAINSASNRYEEAFTLMDALTPKQQQQLVKAAPVKKEAPGAPTNAPKAAALNQSVDVMTMSDSEFDAWRNSQRRRR
tara:strand:+ start:4206 stop:4844 length:639 start_codon:yes stop_codon:yes gene_type:complete